MLFVQIWILMGTQTLIAHSWRGSLCAFQSQPFWQEVDEVQSFIDAAIRLGFSPSKYKPLQLIGKQKHHFSSFSFPTFLFVESVTIQRIDDWCIILISLFCLCPKYLPTPIDFASIFRLRGKIACHGFAMADAMRSSGQSLRRRCPPRRMPWSCSNSSTMPWEVESMRLKYSQLASKLNMKMFASMNNVLNLSFIEKIP